MKAVVIAALLGLVAVATPVWAELITEPEGAEVEKPSVEGRRPATEAGKPAASGSSLDIDFKLGANSFRFGSRFFGHEGYSGGAWLNGEMRPDGFSVDGRVEGDGKVHNFKLNADIDEWVRRAARIWGLTNQ